MLEKLYGKNINFLIGSGASYGAIPTLATDFLENEQNLSFEDILTKYKDNEYLKDVLYLYFYENIIKKSFLNNLETEDNVKNVLKNYKTFIAQLIQMMYRESYQKDKRINIFTTNYDLFFEKAVDNLIGQYEFYFNDGSSGNITKKLNMKNFYKKIYHTGNFNNFDKEIPIINLFKIHGSVSWEYIYDEYNENPLEIKIDYKEANVNEFDDLIRNIDIIENISNKSLENIIANNRTYDQKSLRKELQKKFVLVFPEKDKFEKTLYEEYYYQFLRQLSYELERKNTVLVVFGFSFADEHIAELIKRACNNPSLKVYIFCYDNKTSDNILKNLKLRELLPNIEFIVPQGKDIDFNIFLNKLFEIKSDNNAK